MMISKRRPIGRIIRQPPRQQFLFKQLEVPLDIVGVPVFNLFASATVVLGGSVAQYGRPSTDTVNQAWEREDGTTATIFNEISETPFDDVKFIRSPLAPALNVYVTKLTPVTDPLSSSGHTIRFRYGKDVTLGARIDLLIELRQAYVSEANLGTLIATLLNASDIAVYPIAGTYTLTGPEADSITDYANLYLRFRANQV